MGGRGAGSKSIPVKTFEHMVRLKENVSYNLNMQKGVSIQKKGYEAKLYTYSKAKEQMKNINDAVVEVPKGDYERRIKLLKESGYKIKAQTKFNKKDEPYRSVLIYVTR